MVSHWGLLSVVSCKTFDPRCLVCNSTACLQCVDPILNSIRRSGARNIDLPLPADELSREFSFKFSYGSQDPRVFDEAETFVVVPASLRNNTFLNESAKICAQGLSRDASWTCNPSSTSHRVCGHPGVFSFSSPIYAIAEAAQNITLTVRRSGGGFGAVIIGYELQYLDASSADVSPTVFYTSSQQLEFQAGVVELSFMLTIHDDHITEGNETFRVLLREPAGSSRTTATLGNQRNALVTIIDDDAGYIDAAKTAVTSATLSVLQAGMRAGNNLVFQIQSAFASGTLKLTGGDTLLMESYEATDSDDGQALSWQVNRGKLLGVIVDNQNGTYTCTWQRKTAGMYTVAVYALFPGGLRGDYYADAWLGDTVLDPVVSRIDRNVNFTWGIGPVFAGATDYLSVRWSGRLKPKATGDITFYVSANDQMRLWIGDLLLLDGWDNSFTGNASGTLWLNSSLFYSVVLEYRELVGNADVYLSWSESTFPKEIIPAAYLYTDMHIQGSPFTNISVIPAITANVNSTVVSGAMNATAARMFLFQILPRDAFGNPRRVLDGKDTFRAQLTLTTDLSLGGKGSRQIDAKIVWNPVEQVFQVSGIPFVSGQYALNVSINSTMIYGGPFQVNVQPAPLHPTRSVVSGNGLLVNRVAGIATTINMEARDINNNRIYTPERQLSRLELRAYHTTHSGAIDTGTVVSNGDGTYIFTYTPRFSGTYNVRITWKGVDVNNSPYLVSVVPNSPNGTTSSAAGSGLLTALTNIQATFTITSRDLNSNLVSQGGATAYVVLAHPTKGNVSGLCTDLRSGQYSCTYTAKYVGMTHLHVGLAYLPSSPTILPIIGSPFALNVSAGPALGSLSYAQGGALVSSIAGMRMNFTVFIRDSFDNDKLNAGQETITVVFKGPAPSTSQVPASISSGTTSTYVGSGQFFVSYVLKTKGNYTLQVQVNSVDIASSPFTVYNFPAVASPLTTSLDLLTPTSSTLSPLVYRAGGLITARLTTRDVFGNVLQSGGYRFALDGAMTFIDTPLADENNGSYFLALRPLKSRYFPFAPKLFLPGGLRASYYQTPDLNESVILSRLDASVDFDFGVDPPTQADAMTTFSVLWKGFLLPEFTEKFTFSADVMGGVRVIVNDTLLLADLWPVANGASKQLNYVYLVANQLVPFEVSFSKPKSEPNASIRLFWQSLSQRKQVVPSNRLFTTWDIVNNVPALNIVPNDPDYPTFTAEYPAASLGNSKDPNDRVAITVTSGIPFTFHVIARDKFENPRVNGGDILHVLFPQAPDDAPLNPGIVDFLNGTYAITILPLLSGQFAMFVSANPASMTSYDGLVGTDALVDVLQPFQISQSPFTLVVQPNIPMATTTTLLGSGFYRAVAGAETSFSIQLRDVNSNFIPGPVTQPVVIRLVRQVASGNDQRTALVTPVITAAEDGTYLATYTATVSDLYEVQLSVTDTELFVTKSSSLYVDPNSASALTSTVAVTGNAYQVQMQVSVNTPQSYYVTLRDFYSNPLEIGGDDLIVHLHGPQALWGTVTDLSNGQYLVTYRVAIAGLYELQTQLADVYHGLSAFYYTSSRFVAGVRAVDPLISFDWAKNQTMRGFPRVQWRGFIKPAFTEVYTLQLKVRPAGSVSIDSVSVIDTINTDPLAPGQTTAQGLVSLEGGRLHAITVEYQSASSREDPDFLELWWQSDRQQLEVVPTTAFRPGAQEIQPRYYLTAV